MVGTLVYKQGEDIPACKEEVGTQAYKQVCKALVQVYMGVVDTLVCMAHTPALVEFRRSLCNGSSNLSTLMQQQRE